MSFWYEVWLYKIGSSCGPSAIRPLDPFFTATRLLPFDFFPVCEKKGGIEAESRRVDVKVGRRETGRERGSEGEREREREGQKGSGGEEKRGGAAGVRKREVGERG